MNGQAKVTWRMLHTISHAPMVHAGVLEVYINVELMYTTYHIFPVLPIKDLVKKDGDPSTPFKLVTGTRPLVSHLGMLFCLCVVRKATAQVGTKTLNMSHHA